MKSKTTAKGLLCRLFSCLLLIGSMAFSTSSYGDHNHPKAGTADQHNAHGGGLYVTAAFGPDDRLWRIVPEKKHVYVDYSTDLGKTFSTPVRVNSESQRIKVSGENRPGIAVDGSGRIYVIYAAEGTQPVAQYFSMSTDNGRNFSTPRPISSKASEANSSLGQLALSFAGKVYIFWLDERDRTDWRKPGNAMYFATIVGQDTAESANQKLSDSLCECCRIAAAFDKENQPVLLSRFIYEGNIRDHGLQKGRADGEFSIPWRVTFDEWKIEGCPEHGPAISIGNDDRYHIAWFTQGSVRQGLFYAYSSDGGQHFSDPLPFGDSEKLASHADILAQGKNIVLTWIEFDGEKTQLLATQSSDGGRTWLPPRLFAESTGNTDSPFLLINTRGIFISWNSKKEGYRLIPVD